LAVGGFAILGCDSNKPLPRNENGVYGGGNGAFGENPEQPGEHRHASQSDAGNSNPGNASGAQASPSQQ
jgi:hypothetical protein